MVRPRRGRGIATEGGMGEPLRRVDPPGDPANEELASVAIEEIEAIAHLREAIGTAPASPELAASLSDRFASIRRAALAAGDGVLGEIGLSGELIFAALARRPVALGTEELGFLDNVIAAVGAWGEADSPPQPSELPEETADAFDRLLARLEAA
jgi:hypothetical protein